MAKSTMQKSKILYLVKILQEQTDEEHGITVSEIISALDGYGISAERKSVYDDIETLRAFGMEIEMRKDKQFRYHLISRPLELPELKLLVDSVQSSKFISHKKSMELIGKLESFSSRYQARRLSRQVYVAGRIKTMNESIYYNVDFIHEAISTNSQISFQYFDWDVDKKKALRHDGKTYLVSPWALTRDDENYYLIAFDSEVSLIKHYRVDKMINISMSDTHRDGAEHFEDFDLALYTKKTFGMYHGEEALVTLRCKNSLSSVIIDRFGSDVTFFKRDDNTFDIHVNVAISPVFFSWVTILGDGIEIISPQSMRDKFTSRLHKILAKYE